MSPHVLKAAQMMDAAVPASGFRPETPEEWKRALGAVVELGYSILREHGHPKRQARALAEQIWGGAAGMQILKIAFSEARDE
jgi:hypothetical protein